MIIICAYRIWAYTDCSVQLQFWLMYSLAVCQEFAGWQYSCISDGHMCKYQRLVVAGAMFIKQWKMAETWNNANIALIETDWVGG